MRIGLLIDEATGFHESADLLPAYEEAGLGLVCTGEAYSFDAVSKLGYLAARTEGTALSSSIMQLYTRTPTLIAMTAAGLDMVSDGRFELGLGASGPQVIEGFHGVAYDAPLARTRETISICRSVWRRERLEHRGEHYRIPLPTDAGGSGLGKSLKLINTPVRAEIPISLAALGPRNVALAAELADGWQPLFFHPDEAEGVWGAALTAGAARRDPALGSLAVQVQVSAHLGEPSEQVWDRLRGQLALYIGGMGAPGANFYHRLACRYGYTADADRIQQRYLAGDHAGARRAVPSELIRAVSLVGEESVVRERIAAYARAGVTTLVIKALAPDPRARLEQVSALLRLADVA